VVCRSPLGRYGRGASATVRTACSFAEETLATFGEVSRKIAARYRMMASTGTSDQAGPDRHAGALFVVLRRLTRCGIAAIDRRWAGGS
jgi:hypothetical protein